MNCLQCGKVLESKPLSLLAKYASDGTVRSWKMEGSFKTKYCSAKCGQDYKNAQRRYPRVCKLCGINFLSSRKIGEYCSSRCAKLGSGSGKKQNDLTGQRFNHLVALRSEVRQGSDGSHVWWLCQCDCGNQKWVVRNVLGYQKSCGCLKYANARTGPHKLVSRICVICEKGFTTRVHNKPTCSDKCHKLRILKKSREWNKTHGSEYRQKLQERNIAKAKGEKQWLLKAQYELGKIRRYLRRESRKASPSQDQE